jgi:diguanylate cyclase (GGDEF)-like protein
VEYVDALGDPGYLRFRRGSVKLASTASLIAAAMIAAYAIATWGERSGRGALLAIAAAVMAGVGVLNLLNAERLVETRWCDLFFGAWSATYVGVITVLALLDGGAGSPLLITFFAPLVFAGTCYPLKLAARVGVAVVAAYLALSMFAGPVHDRSGSLYIAGLLALVAGMCAWQAHTLEGGRRELALASRTDHLTGTLNRRGFQDRAEAELARAERLGEHAALVLVDLDGFKRVNDEHGHAAGDELLRWVSARLQSALRTSDAACRLGGDEFALLLPGMDAVAAREVAERLRTALAERTSASFGVAAFPAQPDAEALLARADVELYAEKPGRGDEGFDLTVALPSRVWT